jgi:hypothetical protein
MTVVSDASVDASSDSGSSVDVTTPDASTPIDVTTSDASTPPDAPADTAAPDSPAPTPTGTLTWRPPGYIGGDPRNPANYPGYIVVNAPSNGGSLNLDDSHDYFIQLGHVQWSSAASGNSSLDIDGGRNRVIIGGQITTISTNLTDDIRALVIDGGDPAGITHVEGILFDQSVNAITLRTPQTVQIENVRVSNNHVYRDDFSTGIHPDLIQTWGTPNEVRTDHFTGYTDYTGLSVLLTPNPTRWTRYNVDLHALPPQPGSVLSGTLPLAGNMVYFGDARATQYIGQNIWMETGYYDASYRRKLDDVIGYGGTAATYELHPGPGLSGSVFTSAVDPTGGSGTSTNPPDLGRRQGDTITFARVPLLAQEAWQWGRPTGADGADANGNFVPAASVGVGYVSPRYR